MVKKLLLPFLFLLLAGLSSQAITITSANGGGSWSNTAAWSPAQIPTAADSVVISVGNPITVNSATYANSLSINVQPSAVLTINGSTYVNRVLRNDGTMNGIAVCWFTGGGAKTIEGTGVFGTTGAFNFNGGSTTINSTITKGGNFNLLSSGVTVTNNGTLTLTTGTVSIFTTATWIQGVNSNLSVYNNMTGGGTLNATAAGNRVTFSNNCTQIYNAGTYHHLTITVGTKTLQGATAVNGNFTISNNTTYNGNGFVMTLRGNWINSSGASNTINADVTFAGTAAQTFSKPAFTETLDDVTIASTSTVSPVGCALSVTGTFTLNSGTYDVTTSNRSLFCYGNWVNNGGTFTPRSGTVFFGNSTGPFSLTKSTAGAETFFNFQKLNASVFTLNSNINVSGALTIASGATLACAGAQTITLTGNWVNNGGTFTPATSTVSTNGAGAQNVGKTIAATETFHHFTKGTANTVTLTSPISCSGNFFLAAGTLNVSASNHNISVAGNATFNGTCTNNSNTWTLNGSGAQTVSGTTNQIFFNLTINNTGAGVTQTNGNHRVTSILTPTAGNYATAGTATLSLLSTAASTAIIGNGAGTFSGTGFIIQRFISARAANWHDFGPPVSTSTVADWDNEIYMSGVGGPDGNACCPVFQSVNTYSEPVGDYVAVTSTATALTPGTGYTIFLGDDLTNWAGTSTIDSRGTPNFGTQSFVLSYTGASLDPGGHLIGNPHAAFMDWDAIVAASTNLDGTFYMFDNNGNYVAFGSGDVIPPHQGFFVYTDVGGGSIDMPQSVKTNSTASTFNRVPRPYDLKLKLTSPSNLYWHEIFVDLDETATSGYDKGRDARFVKSPQKDAPSLTMVMNSDRLLIRNAFAPIEDVVMIPLRARTGISGSYTISADGASGIDEYSCVLLKDLFTGNVIDLKEKGSYTFDLNKNDDPNRFMLYMIRNKSECDDILAKPAPNNFFSESQVFIQNDGNSVFVQYDLDKITPVTVTVFDAVGKLISESRTEGYQEKQEIQMPSESGMYIVKVLVNGQTITRKVVLNK